MAVSEVAQNEAQEFWRPPEVAAVPAIPSLAEACERCGSEYMVGAKFCHTCGRSRLATESSFLEVALTRSQEVLEALDFQGIQDRLHLTLASMIAFIAGLGCLLGAIAVGFVYSVQTLSDFQAIQLWRIEWLLGAAAAFLAGILLNRDLSSKS